jgi:hypothetical protein
MSQSNSSGPSRSPVRRAALGLLALFGWHSVLVWPPEPRGVIIVYPHTSNWDFIIGMLFKIGYGLPANWIGKAEMFPKPFKGLLEWMGGIPLDRRRTTIAPEGTRSHTDHLKSGFYQIAVAAGVPVALAYIDYGSRRVGIDTYLHMTGDRDADLERIRAFYATKRGRHPEFAGELRWRR